MSDPTPHNLAWLAGALLVLATVGLYLWFTTPEDPILPDTYTVM